MTPVATMAAPARDRAPGPAPNPAPGPAAAPGSAFRSLAVVGLGYIGLPTAAVFARGGIPVLGVDIDPVTVETVNAGRIHIVEPELDLAVEDAVLSGFLRAAAAPEPADAFLIAVPTPFLTTGAVPEPDLACVAAAARAIAPVLKPGDLVILESTCPVGTTEALAGWLAEARPDLGFPQDAGEGSDIRIAHCPERVLPGRILHELVENDRVIGGMTPACARRAAELYGRVVRGDCVLTDCRTAEMAKLAENSFRDVNIAFANELSMICGALGIDVWELIRLANRHPRVNVLQPGPGVGGHCIAVDPWFIVSRAPDQARLIRTARAVNDAKPAWVLREIDRAVADLLAAEPDRKAADVAIACFGLSFKPDVDDLRESPACAIVRSLASRHPGRILAVEPNIAALPADWPPSVARCDAETALAADVLVMLVDHAAFRAIPRARVAGRRVVDTRGIWA
jgi:UDP-N-acetyl-D-mannosaminuronic acid dehydrogenase